MVTTLAASQLQKEMAKRRQPTISSITEESPGEQGGEGKFWLVIGLAMLKLSNILYWLSCFKWWERHGWGTFHLSGWVELEEEVFPGLLLFSMHMGFPRSRLFSMQELEISLHYYCNIRTQNARAFCA